jgi:hypothetical protein
MNFKRGDTVVCTGIATHDREQPMFDHLKGATAEVLERNKKGRAFMLTLRWHDPDKYNEAFKLVGRVAETPSNKSMNWNESSFRLYVEPLELVDRFELMMEE